MTEIYLVHVDYVCHYFLMTLLFVTNIPALVGVKSTNAAVLSTQTFFCFCFSK